MTEDCESMDVLAKTMSGEQFAIDWPWLHY